MKTTIAFILLSILTTKGCHKNSVTAASNQLNISGVWELSKTKGGNIRSGDFPPGNGNLIKFTGDKYEVWANKELLNSGTYELAKDSAGNYMIIYQGSLNSRDTILLDGDLLTLKPSHPDFATRIYKRIGSGTQPVK